MIEDTTYINQVRTKLAELLQSRKSSASLDEKLIQDFFEQHPCCLLPIIANLPASYSIYGNVIITQPRFKSLAGDKQPDFLVVTSNSLNLYFNFIEIEDPVKKIFNKPKLVLSNHFNQAYGQLKTWNTQIDGEVRRYCQYLLKTAFETNTENRFKKEHHYTYSLVYGFSEEIQDRGIEHNSFLQSYFSDKQFHHCTYSRILKGLTSDKNLITVKVRNSKFIAVGMTPFEKYGIEEWYDFHDISEKIDVVKQNQYLSDADKIKLNAKMSTTDLMSRDEAELYFLGPKPVGGLRKRFPFDGRD